jgi:hypothetical protein
MVGGGALATLVGAADGAAVGAGGSGVTACGSISLARGHAAPAPVDTGSAVGAAVQPLTAMINSAMREAMRGS